MVITMTSRSIAECEQRVSSLADTVRGLKAQDPRSSAVDDHVAMLLAAKADLAEMLQDRVAALSEMVSASGKPACDAVKAEIEELKARREALVPKGKKATKAESKAKKQAEAAAASSASQSQPVPLPTNACQWPETEALPLEVCERIDVYLGQLQMHGAGSSAAAAARARLDAFLHGAHVTATVKLDGTNVGKSASGELVGRRHRLTESVYCKTSLEPLASVDADAVRTLLATELPAAASSALLVDASSPCIIYGELLINDYYDYKEEGMYKGWRAFGVVMEARQAENEGAHAAVVDSLSRAGWAASASGGARVRLAMCPRLVDLFERARVPTVPIVDKGTSGGGVCALVARQHEAMLEQRGEGLVVTIQTALGEGGGGGEEGAGEAAQEVGELSAAAAAAAGSIVRKWKISAEHQPRCIASLRSLRRRLASPSVPPEALPDGVIELIDRLLGVATAPLSERFKATTGAAQPNKYLLVHKKQPPEREGSHTWGDEDGEAIEEALRSALTKFDALEALFGSAPRAAGRRRCSPADVCAMLRDEMRGDLEALGLDDKGEARAAERVSKFVGREYARYAKQQKQRGEQGGIGGGGPAAASATGEA